MVSNDQNTCYYSDTFEKLLGRKSVEGFLQYKLYNFKCKKVKISGNSKVDLNFMNKIRFGNLACQRLTPVDTIFHNKQFL
jgi:hypothetical protein